MSRTTRFKRAKVARRMLALFLFGALVPIGGLALFSFSRVVDRLNTMRGSDLQVVSDQVVHDVEDRIQHLADEFSTALSGTANAARETDRLRATLNQLPLRDSVRGAVVMTPGGRTLPLLDTLTAPVQIDSAARAALGDGRPVFHARPGSPPMLALVSRADPVGNLLVVEVLPAALFVGAISKVGDRAEEVCVVNADWAPLRCSAPLDSAALATLAAAQPGTFVSWEADGEGRLGGLAIATADNVHADQWAVVATAASITLFTAVGDLGRFFIIATAVLLLGVFVFSHLQIRRSLKPLKMLQDATAKIADRRYGEPVVVTSGDEFEELARSFNTMAEQVESQFRAMTAMNEIGRSVLSTAKINEIVDTVLDRAPNIAACNAVVFCLREKRSDTEPEGAAGWKVQARPVGGAETITANVAPTRAEVEELWNCATQVTVDLNASPRSYVDLVELVKRGVIYFVVFPIQLKNEVAGAIAMGFTEEPDVSGDNITRGKRLVDQVTVALQNAELINELNKLNFGTISALARTIDASSPWTAGHSTRVTKMALDIAKELRLPQQKINVLHRGGLLHDIGKIGTPPTILNKPGRLDPDELKIMQDHTVVGAKILAPIPQYAEIIPIVRHHHERLDGKGYPDGIGGDEIPFLARVLAVADVFDALISDRPYRAGWAEERVVAEIQRMSGTHLDPQVVEAFLTVKAPTLSGTRKSIPYLSVEVDDFYTWID